MNFKFVFTCPATTRSVTLESLEEIQAHLYTGNKVKKTHSYIQSCPACRKDNRGVNVTHYLKD